MPSFCFFLLIFLKSGLSLNKYVNGVVKNIVIPKITNTAPPHKAIKMQGEKTIQNSMRVDKFCIKNDLIETSVQSENVKVDFKKSEIGGYLFLRFDAVDEQTNLIKTYSAICNLETHEKVEGKDLFQDSFYDYFSSEVRYQVKESGLLGDLAYSREFYEMTMPSLLHEFELYMDEEGGVFSLVLYLNNQEVLIDVEIEMKQLASYFKEDEVMYESADSVVHPVRHYVDSNRPMVALTFDDGPSKSVTIPILLPFALGIQRKLSAGTS